MPGEERDHHSALEAQHESKAAWKKKAFGVSGFVAAAAATALIAWVVDYAVTDATTHKPPPVTVSVQTNDEQLPAFEESPIAAVIPSSDRREAVSPRSCSSFYREIRLATAVPSPLLLQLVVQSDTSDAVLIENMSIHILSRRRPVKGQLVECTAQGVPQFRSISVDLDTTPPRVRYSSGKGYAPFGFTLRQGETEIFDVTASSNRANLMFDIDLSLIVGGQPRTMEITDDGRPFQVSAASSTPWSWDYGSWISKSAGHLVQVEAGQRFPSGS